MRRHMLPHPRFQIYFSLAFIKGALVMALIPGATLFMVMCLLFKHPALTFDQRAVLSAGLNQLISLYFQLLAVSLVVFTVLGGILSHKFAGPMARIEDWASRQLSQSRTGAGLLRLRPDDEWAPIVHILNRVLRKYL